MSNKITCPSLSPKCDGELRISERQVRMENRSFGSGDLAYVMKMPVMGHPKSALCQKCGKKWTKEHLRDYNIDINELTI